ncbi:MAG TPA: hypothetical protein VNZ66_10845 [Aeromicrobium sp.]|nr:hypothetical protein [Aeromicrobium sp.]
MDWDDEMAEPDEGDAAEERPHHDLAGTLLSANGLLVAAFGVLLMLTPAGNRESVDAPDFGGLEATGVLALGVVLIVASVWRRDRKIIGPVVGFAGLFGSVAILAVLDVALLAICPAAAVLALINRPYPSESQARQE